MMKLYNTLTRQVEELKLLKPPKVGVYTCGPTVYDYAHIGHWFNYVRMDMLIRSLKASGYSPIWVMNITDVGHLVSDADEGEDKLEKGAKRENKTAWEVAKFYENDFMQGLEMLNITKPDFMPRATEHIKEQIELIKQLESKGYTYIIDDGVYYDSSLFEGYESFAELDLDEQQAGARVSYNSQKRNLSDFALWKFSPKDSKRDMEWDSPWGKGFPGWHIECSAMSMKYLGPTLDIHTGGIDHIPVHHTNEIAQSEVVTGKRFANYWLHSNHVTIDGQKISKSLGNGIGLDEIVKHGYSPETIRTHILESSYRNQSKFSLDNLQAAKNRLQDIVSMAAMRWQASKDIESHIEPALITQQIKEFLCDDLNTPAALNVLSNLSTSILSGGISTQELSEFNDMLEQIDNMLGYNLSKINDINDDQKQAIQSREAARSRQEWAQSDQIRDNLLSQGIGLRDTPNGAYWFPVL